MKTLFSFLCLVILSCTLIEEPIRPIHCYQTNVVVSSTSGKILSTEVYESFFTDKDQIEKCKCAAMKETIQIKDTIQHLITIQTTSWIYPDTK